ncbi:YjbH domain-containing protein [Vibrio sp. T187]|uniref:YjbH domain-containing protein n=1 Tax=Vibrio TaxID=662 RepID=UPI0010C9F62A|nr:MULTISPECIES: YjbH domain-containing protein [Vibrio]MBW3697579.1 YjbH domain-containing protein [Vibrio sp. T187]
MRSVSLFPFSLLSMAVVSSFSVRTESFSFPELKPSQMDFGGTGLMQMPTGRMSPEGEFNVGGSWNNEYHMYNVSLQLMPWFEATIRYTLIQDLFYSNDPSFSGDTAYTDKGIDFKARLLKETYYLPEVAVGIRDFGGTGLYDGEFIAGTKRFGPLDVTLGMGWGYMGQSGNVTNPFCKASEKFCERSSDTQNNGGSVDFERWFKGPASIYGGLEYQTSYTPLSFKLEYDSNDYTQDFPVTRGGVNMTQHTPWNVGAVYRLDDWGVAKVSYERGDTLTLGFNLTTNFNELKGTWRDTEAPLLRPHEVESVEDIEFTKLSQELDIIAGYENNQIMVDEKTIIVKGDQVKYRDRNEALERAAAVIANAVPDYITTYQIVEAKQSNIITEQHIDAEQYRKVANDEYVNANVSDSVTEHEPSGESKVIYFDGRERFDYSVSPHLTQSFGSAENFYLYNLGINTGASLWLSDKVQMSGSVYFNLLDNYDQFNYIAPPDGTSVPRVRTMFRDYVHDNPVRMDHLQMTWFEDYSHGIYSQAYAGYLESMFAGVGGEILYRPLNSNWAIGADLTAISQRDPDSWLGVYDQERQFSEEDGRYYNVMTQGTTGFITGYYMPKWKMFDDTLFKLGFGKFLAGDVGTRIDFSKQFKSGVIAGAFASFTNMSVEDYGEGSYTKGFYVSIPFDLITVKPSGNRAGFEWLPITRDGGQMLNKQHELFNQTDARSSWLQRPNSVE